MKITKLLVAWLLTLNLIACMSLANTTSNDTNTSTAITENTPVISRTNTPVPQGKITRTPSFPFGYEASLFQEKGDCSKGDTYNIGFCIAGKAYQSARDLDALINELDYQFPNGAWETALNRMILPQEKWESYKQPYCEISAQDSIVGTGHGADFMSCIDSQNRERIERLNLLICTFTRGFVKCPPSKSGGDFNITAIPLMTATP